MRVLDEKTKNHISFVGFIVPEFAEAYKMDKSEGYHYLKNYGGMNYINNHWEALHMENPRNVIREIFELCQKNGGWMR
jgi:hypothetical protein